MCLSRKKSKKIKHCWAEKKVDYRKETACLLCFAFFLRKEVQSWPSLAVCSRSSNKTKTKTIKLIKFFLIIKKLERQKCQAEGKEFQFLVKFLCDRKQNYEKQNKSANPFRKDSFVIIFPVEVVARAAAAANELCQVSSVVWVCTCVAAAATWHFNSINLSTAISHFALSHSHSHSVIGRLLRL